MHKVAIFLFALAVTLAACTSDEADSLGSGHAAIGAHNALAYNRLVYNRLVYNRLAYNRLSQTTADELAGTSEGRELLHYIALCSLAEGDSVAVTSDGVTYVFNGNLGLAPGWKNTALSVSEARWVSACLLAHVNAFGTSVLMSIRADGKLSATHDELQAFPVYEATFFGQVFGDTLQTYACIGSDRDIALALSPDRALRVCSDGTGECEVTSLGYCRDICEQRTANGGWSGCLVNGFRYDETVSTYLAAYEETCTSDIASDSFSYVCSSSHTASICSGDECQSAQWEGNHYYSGRWNDMAITVSGGSRAAIDCFGSDDCDANCHGNGTYCDVDCYGAEKCDMACLAGASCVLTCKNAQDCGISICEGTLQVCGNTVVCNGVCPQ